MDPFSLFTAPVDEIMPPALTADEFARLPVMRGLEEIQAVAVALSGGPDSMALLALVHEWAQARSIMVHAITVDHALRAESQAEAQRVSGHVATYFPGVRHKILRRDPENITATKLQEQARHDRYEMMADECRAQGIKHLLLAHHQDDQAETFLFRLCKGSGTDGLAGMREQVVMNDVVRVRPLLGIEKEQLVATCRARDLPFVNDPSNGSDKFARVRLRQAMGALTREGLSIKRLALTAWRLGRARAALDHYAAVAWERALLVTEGTGLTFDLAVLMAEPEDIRLRVLMRALTVVGDDGFYGPRLERVEELAQIIFTESGFARTTIHRCLIEKSAARRTLSICKENA